MVPHVKYGRQVVCWKVPVLRRTFSLIYLKKIVGRNGWDGKATRYKLEGRGIESQWGARFSAPAQTVRGAPRSLWYNWGRLSFPGVNRPGRAVNDPSPSGAEFKERVKLYLYSPLGLCGLFRLNCTFLLLLFLAFPFVGRMLPWH